jgi:hypothetical protein
MNGMGTPITAQSAYYPVHPCNRFEIPMMMMMTLLLLLMMMMMMTTLPPRSMPSRVQQQQQAPTPSRLRRASRIPAGPKRATWSNNPTGGRWR